MENKIIDLTGKKGIKSITSKEKIALNPKLVFTIEFDDNQKMIIDLELLGKITSRVCDELDAIEKRTSKNISMALIAMLMAMGGKNDKELKKILKDLK